MRFGESAYDNDQRFGLVDRFVVKAAEEPVVVPTRAVHPDFEPSGHVTPHCFPVASSGKAFGGCSGDLHEYGAHSSPDLDRTSVEEGSSWNLLVPVILRVTSEEHHLMRIVRRRTGPDLNLGCLPRRSL